MSSKSRQTVAHDDTSAVERSHRGMWGAFAGLIVGVLIAVPLSASIGYATHPATRALFGGHLGDASRAGFAVFWWVVALLCLSLPFIVGYGVARLSAKTLGVLVAVVAVFVIAIVVLGQLFVFV